MFNFIYPAKITKDQGGFYFVKFIDIDRAATDGESLEEALEEASDCLAEAIAMRIANRLEIPRPSKVKRGEYAIPLSAAMSAKTALYIAFSESGLTQKQLAEKMGVDPKEVRRMLSPKYQTKINRVEKALQILGKRLFVSMDQAA